jgi:hypothetical protein
MKVYLPDDLFVELCTWLGSLSEAARLWESLCLLRQGIKADSNVWALVVRNYYSLRDPNPAALENSLLRGGIRGNEAHGLMLLRQLSSFRKCSRSGCLLKYRETENSSSSCYYHPGKLRNNLLSCCKSAGFRSLGCKKGYHDGELHANIWVVRAEQQNSDKIDEKSDTKLPQIIVSQKPQPTTMTTRAKTPSVPSLPPL